MKKKLLVLLLALSLILSNFSGIMFVSADSSIVLSQGFEDGNVGSWAKLGWGGDGTVSVTEDDAAAGVKSLKFTRAARNSSLSLNVTSLMLPGRTYDLSFKLKLAADEDTIHLGSKVAAASLSNQYPWLIGNNTVNATDWTTFEMSNYEVPADTTEFLIWVEAVGDASTTLSDILMDEVLIEDVTPVAPPVEVFVLNQGFEDGSVGTWAYLPWTGTGTTEVSTDVASAGTKSLKFNRDARNSSLFMNITSYMTAGKTFDLSFKARIAADTDTFHLASKVASPSASNQYPWLIGNQTVNSTEWTTFELKNYTVPADTTEFLIWLEAAGDATTLSALYIDEFTIKDLSPSATPSATPDVDDGRPDALPFSTITFEDQTAGGFIPRAGTETLTVTNEANHTTSGSYALKVEGRTTSWHGPSLRVETFIEKGQEYNIKAWVKLLSPDSAQLQLSTQVGNGDGASYNNLQGKTVATADGWVQYEGKYRYSSVGDEYVTIYVESSNNATASFYIDDITFTPTGTGTIEIQDLTPIKDVYANYFLIGNIVSAKDFEGERLKLLKKHHEVVTAENAMKPVYAYGTYPDFDFTAEDALVAQAAAAGLDMHGHVLVWHSQSEDSLHTADDGTPLTKEVALANLRNHVTTVVNNFSDDVISWDVVNEAVSDTLPTPSDWRSSLRQSGWLTAIGPDFIKEAFLAAKAAIGDKNIKLYYNDYNDDNQSKAEAIYQMVKEINAEYALAHDGDLLIDGIGLQSHYNLNTNPENVEKSLKKFISVTDEVSITELDITAGSNSTLTEQQEEQQAYLYAKLFVLYKQYAANIARVTFWGLDDATSWRASQNPLLFDGDLQAKEAYYAVIDPEAYLEEHQPEAKVVKQATAAFGTPTVDGSVDAMWNNAVEIQINQYQTALQQGATGVAKAMWDNTNLYVLVQVSDDELDKGSANPWEQDSVEVFVDQNNGKSSSYEPDDGQHRVNYENTVSLSPSTITGFVSATSISGTNYIVEMKIPLSAITPVKDMKLGFDVTINDGKDGARTNVAAWNDLTGTGYMDPSVYGELTLLAAPSTGNTNTGGGTTAGGSTTTTTTTTPTVTTPTVTVPVVETPVTIDDGTETIPEAVQEVVPENTVPQAGGTPVALPKTAGMPVAVVYGLGLGFAGIGLLLKRKSQKEA